VVATNLRCMIDHLGIGCADLAAGAAFYDQVLAVLGHSRVMDVGVAIGYGSQGRAVFWISHGTGPNRETHIAFTAPDVAAVHAFHAAAIAAGAEELHAPRFWPEYHAGYFGAFVRDPDGNNVEAVCHTAGPGEPVSGAGAAAAPS
jgi:catechol 2,3-dioxygenase-like lactoylglutathione lyase family enzyme